MLLLSSIVPIQATWNRNPFPLNFVVQSFTTGFHFLEQGSVSFKRESFVRHLQFENITSSKLPDHSLAICTLHDPWQLHHMSMRHPVPDHHRGSRTVVDDVPYEDHCQNK